jgi:hypothetical protein
VRRRIFSLASLLSLLLCVATVVLWIRTRGGSEGLQQSSEQLGWDVIFERGNLSVEWDRAGDESVFEVMPLTHRQEDSFFEAYQTPLHGLGFDYKFAGFRVARARNPEVLWRVCVPGWFLWIFFLLLPCLWLWRYRTRRRESYRRSQDLCMACGYALTGNTSGVCPECGTSIQARS